MVLLGRRSIRRRPHRAIGERLPARVQPLARAVRRRLPNRRLSSTAVLKIKRIAEATTYEGWKESRPSLALQAVPIRHRNPARNTADDPDEALIRAADE